SNARRGRSLSLVDTPTRRARASGLVRCSWVITTSRESCASREKLGPDSTRKCWRICTSASQRPRSKRIPSPTAPDARRGRTSSHLLPHLKDRPITVERLPDGINGPRFWQKNTPPYYPSWIKRIELPTESGKRVQYSLVNDLDTLLYFVNQGAITFHVYMSRI